MKPRDVLRVYDNEGETFDRYTIVLTRRQWPADRGFYTCLGLSSYPTHPQGFSQFSECMLGKHLGKRIAWDALPEAIRAHVRARIEVTE